MVQCAGRLYGDAAEMLVEELLLQGRAQMNVLVTTVTGQVNEALKAQGQLENEPNQTLQLRRRLFCFLKLSFFSLSFLFLRSSDGIDCECDT